MNNIAYLAGVLKGDGSIYKQEGRRPRFQIQTVSSIFANKIVNSAKEIKLIPRLTSFSRKTKFQHPNKTYEKMMQVFEVRIRMDSELVALLKNFNPKTINEKHGFIVGFFQSEGTMRVHKYPNRKCYMVRFYNKDIDLLKQIKMLVSEFGIDMNLRNYEGHVPFLDLQSKKGFEKFLSIFGGK